MPTVAEQLRVAREAKKLTIEELAETTKIRSDHLRALEEGNFNVFSAPIYIRGTVRIYANALKLDTPAVVANLDMELGRTERFSVPPPLTDQKKTILDTITLVLAKVNWKMGLTGLAMLVLVLIAALFVWARAHHKKTDPTKALPPAVYRPATSGDTLPLPKR